MVWHDPQKAEYAVINGQAFPEESKGCYQRFPDNRESITPKHAWNRTLYSTGLSIKFYSTAPVITVRYTTQGGYDMFEMPATGVSGLDLYARNEENMSMICHGDYRFGDTTSYTYNNLVYNYTKKGGYEFELFLPLYNQVTWMEIGTSKDAEFRFIPSDTEMPILVYGTSIANGGCASRPAMAWPAIIKRSLDIPVIDWGFAGSGELDTEIFQQITELNLRLLILDNMPNMTQYVDSIVPRIVRGVHLVRKKSNVPILLVEHDGYTCDETNSVFDKNSWERPNIELKSAFEQLQQEGIKEIYYLTKEEIGITMDATVDNVHSTDYGQMLYANAYLPKIRKILHIK